MVLPVPDYDKSPNIECFGVTCHRTICLETYVFSLSSCGLRYTQQNTSTNIVFINIVYNNPIKKNICKCKQKKYFNLNFHLLSDCNEIFYETSSFECPLGHSI